MPIVDLSILNPTPQAAPTEAEKLAAQVATYKKVAKEQFQQLINLFKAIQKHVWGTGDLAKIQAVFNAWGTDAVELCKLSDAVCAMLEAYTGQPWTVVPTGFALTRNANGTVTVSETA